MVFLATGRAYQQKYNHELMNSALNSYIFLANKSPTSVALPSDVNENLVEIVRSAVDAAARNITVVTTLERAMLLPLALLR